MNTPQHVFFGRGVLEQVPGILAGCGAAAIFLVADRQAYVASGAASVLDPLLSKHSVTRFTDFDPNPSLPEIERGIDRFREQQHDVVIAVGGGTAIDLGKLISLLGSQRAAAGEMIGGQAPIDRSGPPLLAVPTTAGTGSEATHFAVAYVGDRKHSLADPRLLPRFALIDPGLSAAASRRVRAAAGLDAFCQAAESMWAVAATDESLTHAAEALSLARQHLTRAVLDCTVEDLDGLSRAAHLSGRAINISKTTASHAMSYAMTIGFGIPHGIAVAMTLAGVLRYNDHIGLDDCLDPRGPTHVRQRIAQLLERLEVKTVDEGAELIETLIDSVGAPRRLKDAGIEGDSAIRWLAQQVNQERLANNPRRMDEQSIRQILDRN